jgi:DNA-binding NarL/FixJ family response regulator
VAVRVFVLDDHELVRRGVRELLALEPDLEVVGEAATAAEALEKIAQTSPDVVILDVRLGETVTDRSGIEACRDIRSAYPAMPCLMLTAFADDDARFASIMAGASGYVLKQIHGTELLAAIRRVANGEGLLDPEVTAQVLDRLRNPPPSQPNPLEGLSAQECEILGHIAAGRTNREIGAAMFLAEKTIKNYVSTLLGKLGMARRSEAAAFSARVSERQRQSDS